MIFTLPTVRLACFKHQISMSFSLTARWKQIVDSVAWLFLFAYSEIEFEFFIASDDLSFSVSFEHNQTVRQSKQSNLNCFWLEEEPLQL